MKLPISRIPNENYRNFQKLLTSSVTSDVMGTLSNRLDLTTIGKFEMITANIASIHVNETNDFTFHFAIYKGDKLVKEVDLNVYEDYEIIDGKSQPSPTNESGQMLYDFDMTCSHDEADAIIEAYEQSEYGTKYPLNFGS